MVVISSPSPPSTAHYTLCTIHCALSLPQYTLDILPATLDLEHCAAFTVQPTYDTAPPTADTAP